jgi:hypothetical protein
MRYQKTPEGELKRAEANEHNAVTPTVVTLANCQISSTV